tara:strand:- start:851 stop:1360 length:510 start_codon:yes stop_codon:yes gene_type:complete
MKNKEKLSIQAIIIISISLIIITVQFIYLQNVELKFYESFMTWLLGEQENYFGETYLSLTFFTLLIGITTLSDKKHHVNLSLYASTAITLILLISPSLFDNPINYALRKSGVFLIGIILLIGILNRLSYRKFERPCKYYNLPAMDEETSIYDVVYSIFPIIALVTSWLV